MATWTVSDLVPANIPLSLDSGYGYSAVQQNWTIADAPFDAEINAGDRIVSFSGEISVTADATNDAPMLVRLYKALNGESYPVYLDLGTLDPGDSDTYTFDTDVDAEVVDGDPIFSLYFFQQSGGYDFTKLTITAASLTFELSDEAGPETPGKPRFIQVRYADDGANNWSNWRNLSAGNTGSFIHPLEIWRLGMTRHRVWEFMDTSDTAQDVLSASIIAQ